LEYINEINITEAVIHILDNNSDEPVLNEYSLELNEDTYNFLYKHIEKIVKDEDLRYAIFNEGRSIVKELSQEYLNGETDLLTVSKEMAKQLFTLMKGNGNIPSCDLIFVSVSTEYGAMLGILKMDYIKSYIHTIKFSDNKIGINIIPQLTGLPGNSQKLQKCAFIKPVREDSDFHLMVIDKQSKGKTKDNEEYGSNYFISNYLGCTIVENERDMTKNFVKAAETWTRNHLKDDAHTAENVRNTVKKTLQEEEVVDVKALSESLFTDQKEIQNDFVEYITRQGVDENLNVDKQWVDKKLKRVRLKIDKDIDLYINGEAYDDSNRFEINRNGDGSINMVIKHVMNYDEK
jgi:hypothetical protein